MSDIEYLYGNYSGKSALDKKIKNAEEILNQQRQSAEDNLERIFDQENLVRLKAMNVKDMSWQDVEILNEIKKRHENVGKTFDGSDFPQAEEAVPDTTALKALIVRTLNDWIPLVRSRGVAVQAINEDASLQNILSFCNSFKDALKNSQSPVSGEDVSGLEYPDNDEIKWNRDELLAAKSEIEKIIRKLDSR